METKTKDGKYFSELGSWKGLIELIIPVLILKIFGFNMFGFFIAIIAFIIMIFVVPKIFKKDEGEKVSHKKYFNFSTKNWFLFFLIILLAFAIYWFGIRPVMIRKDCSVVKWTASAQPAIPASEYWPSCKEINLNPFDCIINKYDIPNKYSEDPTKNALCKQVLNCVAPKPAQPEEKQERNANDYEYKTCLRENGI